MPLVTAQPLPVSPLAGAIRLDPRAIGSAQAGWAATSLQDRLRVLRRFRHLLAAQSSRFTYSLAHLPRTAAQSLAAEILPLAAACQYVERSAPRLLRTQRLGRRGRPLWVGRTATRIERVALGNVLIIAPANYPLFLPGVQVVQALAAGNAVLLKPGRGGTHAAEALARTLAEAGLPRGLLTVLTEEITAVETALDAGVHKVFLTGSFATGQRILELLAPRAIPAVMELSGCDAAVLLPGHPHGRFVAALHFGLTLNHGQTCIAPRRAFVPREQVRQVEADLLRALAHVPGQPVDPAVHRRIAALVQEAVVEGAHLLTALPEAPACVTPVVLADVSARARIAHEDLFAPLLSLIPYDDVGELPALANASPFALGASIFGPPKAAETLSRQLRAPTVTVNDLIAPTADPRLPFSPGPGSRSGFGTTRGAEGLLEMTVPKVMIVRQGSFLPHLEPATPQDEAMFTHLLRAAHGGSLLARAAELMRFFRTAAQRSRVPSSSHGSSRTE
jgi:acyl-CoA reductase-like NAD-dependent aldehyde dehydrogenase